MRRIKLMKKVVCLLSLVLFVIIHGTIVYAATYYMPDNFANLQEAFSEMRSGDTLIIRNGTYSGTANTISHTQKPLSGTNDNYTTIKAENDGEVTFEGDATCHISAVSYLKFEGLIWRRTIANNHAVSIASATQPHHIKFLRCGVYSNASTGVARREDGFAVSYAHDVLFEDCYSFGNFRYSFYAGGNAERIIFRRCVARVDAYNTQTGISAYMIYDSRNVEIQNCIAIDIDNTASYYQANNNITMPNAFYTRSTSEGYSLTDVNIQGCIALNISRGQFVLGGGGDDFDFINTVFWDGYNGIRSRYGGGSFDHCVSGKISGSTTSSQSYFTEQSNEPITNSIAYGATTYGIQSSGSYSLANYNCLYNNGTDHATASVGANSICAVRSNAIDPSDSDPGIGTTALQYLVRIEDGSDLDGKASDGGDIGATILKQIGVSGTMWGESGYNVVTNENLWPFPNEELIRTKMRTYSYYDINAARGFCADGQTLTKYIWEYMGSTIPGEIYGTVSSELPVAPDNLRVAELMIEWDTSIGDVSGYTIYYGLSEGNYLYNMNVGNVTQYPLSDLSLVSGNTYYFVCRAYNTSGESEDSNLISYALTEPDDVTPPMPTQGVTAEIDNENIHLVWSANNESDLAEYRVYYGTLSRNYGLPAVVTGTEYDFTGLAKDILYYFAVTAVDLAGNESGYSSPEVSSLIPGVAIDTTNPIITIVSPTTGTTYGTESAIQNIAGTSSDAVGVTQITWANSRGGSGTAIGTTNWSVTGLSLAEGSNEISVTARDAAGNTSTDTLAIVYTVSGTVEPIVLQDFEDGIFWQAGGTQDPSGNGRGWAFLSQETGDEVEIDNIGANGSNRSLKITFSSSNSPQLYFRSDSKISDLMPEAQGANRMSFYVRFPENFPIQPYPFRYCTWQLGTYVHDSDDFNDTYAATSEPDHGIHHYYHRLSIEQVGNGWVKYIVNTHPDQANYSGSTVPPDISHYFNSFGRFYFHFGIEAGGPEPPRPFTIWIDEIKFYNDDGSIGGQVHDGGQDDPGFDGEFFRDSIGSQDIIAPVVTITSPTTDTTYDTESISINIGGTASDNVGVTQVTWSNSQGGSGIATGTNSWIVAGISLLEGENIIIVTSRDEAGNQSTDQLTVEYVISDTEVPSVIINSPTSNADYSTDEAIININGTASDNIGVTQVIWSNSAGGSGTASGTTFWNINGISLLEGENIITVAVVDAAGNQSIDIVTVTYLIPDTITPVVTITSPTSEELFSTESGSLDFSGTSSDNVGVTQVTWYNSMGGSGTATGTTNWSVPGITLSEGENIITIIASDVVGNTSSDSIAINFQPILNDSWTIIQSDDFESGWGNYIDGGKDCSLSDKYKMFAHQGNYCVRLQDNSGQSSSFYSSRGIDVATPGFTEIKIEFWYYPFSFETGEDFYVEYYDGRNIYIIGHYVVGRDFENGSLYQEEGIILKEGSPLIFPNNMRIRIRCDASGNYDRVYIDDVIISAR